MQAPDEGGRDLSIGRDLPRCSAELLQEDGLGSLLEQRGALDTFAAEGLGGGNSGNGDHGGTGGIGGNGGNGGRGGGGGGSKPRSRRNSMEAAAGLLN